MVALCVRSIDHRPVVCYARPMLHRAYAAVERGHWIEAGCLLREGVRLLLLADCEWHGATVGKRKARRTPGELLKALSAAGGCHELCAETIQEAIDVGNRAAHCQFVRPVELTRAIEAMHWILDHCATYLQQPTAAGRWS